MAHSRKNPYGYPVTGRDINYAQLVREAWGERWNWPQEQYSFGDGPENKRVFVIYDTDLAINANPDPPVLVGVGNFLVSWTEPVQPEGVIQEINGYNIYESSSATGPWTKLTTVANNVFQYQAASNVGTFYYEVTAYNNNGEGKPSNVGSITAVFHSTTVTIVSADEDVSEPFNGTGEGWWTGGFSANAPGGAGAVTGSIAVGGTLANAIWFTESSVGHAMAVVLEGTLSQNYFNQMQFTDKHSVVETYLTSAATYSTTAFPGFTLWYWPAILNFPFTNAAHYPITFS